MKSSIVFDGDLEAEMGDGTVLRAGVWRPSRPGRYPVILMRTPYNKVQGQDLTFAHPSWYARAGYAVVIQDVRGRWSSGGDFTPFAHEADDGEDTLAWASELPFGNGQVGMYGFSYAGATQLQVSVRNPSTLRCMCPGMASPDFYEGWAYRNGAFSLAFNASWATMLSMDIARRRGDRELEQKLASQYAQAPSLYGILPLSSFPNLGRDQPGSFYQDWIAHETKDDFWRRWDVTDRLRQVNSASLFVGGLYDIFLDGTLAGYQGTRSGHSAGARLIVGPWNHIPWAPVVGDIDFGPEARSLVDRAQLTFFEQWLRGGEEPSGSPVLIFVTGANRWEGFEEWPPQGTEFALYLRVTSRANSLNGDGFLSREKPGGENPDVFTYDPAVPVQSLGGRSCCLPSVAPMGPKDQRPIEALNSVLVYTSDPLEADFLTIGSIRVELFAATSAPDTDWTVKVCDVHPDGTSINIQESIQRARFASGTDKARPIFPNDIIRFAFEVGACAHLFKQGHRIRVDISSSNFPQWDRNLNTGHPLGSDMLSDRIVATQSVFHDADYPSRVVFPLLEL